MRQISCHFFYFRVFVISKLPMRQIRKWSANAAEDCLSKLPMRQIREPAVICEIVVFSKLPMRQISLAVLLMKYAMNF